MQLMINLCLFLCSPNFYIIYPMIPAMSPWSLIILLKVCKLDKILRSNFIVFNILVKLFWLKIVQFFSFYKFTKKGKIVNTMASFAFASEAMYTVVCKPFTVLNSIFDQVIAEFHPVFKSSFKTTWRVYETDICMYFMKEMSEWLLFWNSFTFFWQ